MKIKFKSIPMQIMLSILLIWGINDTFFKKLPEATFFWFIFATLIYFGFTCWNIKIIPKVIKIKNKGEKSEKKMQLVQ